jgi:hypothetical protein
MGTINAIKLTITSHLFNQSIGILGNRIKKIPPTLIYNLNDRTVLYTNLRAFYLNHIIHRYKKTFSMGLSMLSSLIP